MFPSLRRVREGGNNRGWLNSEVSQKDKCLREEGREFNGWLKSSPNCKYWREEGNELRGWLNIGPRKRRVREGGRLSRGWLKVSLSFGKLQ